VEISLHVRAAGPGVAGHISTTLLPPLFPPAAHRALQRRHTVWMRSQEVGSMCAACAFGCCAGCVQAQLYKPRSAGKQNLLVRLERVGGGAPATMKITAATAWRHTPADTRMVLTARG
jgi:hypothetical protein